MMKRFLFAVIFAANILSMSALPSDRAWRVHTQNDGTPLTLLLVGDENFHYYKTAEGHIVMEDKGSYYYATVQGQRLQRSDILAHDAAYRNAEEIASLEQLGRADDDALQRVRSNMPQVTQPRRIGDPSHYEGSKKGLVILVSFDDLDFTMEDPVSTFQDMLNKEGYSNSLGAVGSVHDYFKDMSYGNFDLSFDVVGPFKAPKSSTYYGENNDGHDQRSRVIELLKFALVAADSVVDYHKYDWDEDNEVDQVFMLYAGKGEANGGETWTIWPHESTIGNWPIAYRLDGVVLNTYACGQELDADDKMSGIGTFCHEFSHCLGLPDFYDTKDSESNHGMGTYDVMSGGNYNRNSWIPAAYTGYERNFCGWLKYKELSDPCVVSSLMPIESGGDVFVCANPAHPNEYYLFEQRNKNVGWDRGLQGRGMLIYHVSYEQSRWRYNTVNATGSGKQCMVVVPADNVLSFNNENSDVFPYTSAVPYKTYNSFSDETTPKDELYYKNSDGTYLLHIKLSNIKFNSSSRKVSFVFNDGTVEYGEDPDGIETTSTIKPTSQPSMIYNIYGTAVETMEKGGIYVIKYHDGSTKKVQIK